MEIIDILKVLEDENIENNLAISAKENEIHTLKTEILNL